MVDHGMQNLGRSLCWWRTYQSSLQTRPLATKATTAAALSALASVLTQRHEQSYDWKQIRNEALIGFGLRGAMVHYWHRILDRIMTKIFHGKQPNSFLSAVVKMLIDQIVFAPMLILFYLVSIGVFNGRSLSKILYHLKLQYNDILRVNYQIWPLATVINFRFIPQQLQAGFSNIVSLFWTMYLISKTQSRIAVSPSERDRMTFKERSD